MVIDFHIHLSLREELLPDARDFCDGFWEGKGDWEALLTPERMDAYLEEQGVDLAVGLAEICPLVSSYVTNESIHRRLGESKKLMLFASLNPWIHPNLYEEAHRLADLGFKGAKLYPTYQHLYPNDKRIYPLYRACGELGWPVMFHTGSSIFKGAKMKYGDPLHLDEICVDFPEVNVLAVHGGRGFWYDRAAFLARLHENFYVEISGLPPKKLFDYFPEFDRIAGKVVYGSDWPGLPDIAANIASVRALPISEEAKTAILGGTAAKLLNLV